VACCCCDNDPDRYNSVRRAKRLVVGQKPQDWGPVGVGVDPLSFSDRLAEMNVRLPTNCSIEPALCQGELDGTIYVSLLHLFLSYS
jgi:hypothetical protein